MVEDDGYGDRKGVVRKRMSTLMERWRRLHERMEDSWLKSRPICADCGEHIQDEVYMEPEPGERYCLECWNEYVKTNFMHDND